MDEQMYNGIASWWHLLSPVAEYAAEAALFAEILGQSKPKSVLELGSGGGNNAYYLKRDFPDYVLTDLSPQMIAASRSVNPELRHEVGDMRSLRLDRRFDAVFIHDAITYMTSRADLLKAFQTAAAHLNPGGLVLVVPDETKETFHPGTECGGSDDPQTGRGLRYLEWSYDPDPDDEVCTTQYAFVLREADGTARSLHETHFGGLFDRGTWLDLLEAAGFEANHQTPKEPNSGYEFQIFLGRR